MVYHTDFKDPWEPAWNRLNGSHLLTSVEITVTNRCNLRCTHCAVGETLLMHDPDRIPLDQMLRALDQAPDLTTLSITGGEPSESNTTLDSYVLPILQYARSRGIRTQVNTNLTYERDRYERIVPYVDVLHITWNYGDASDFHRIAWGHGRTHVDFRSSERLFDRMVDNVRALAAAGHFISAESMINRETARHLGAYNRFLAQIGCRRHEVHPMYPVDWAVDLPVVSLDEYREAVGRLLAERDPDLWLLFGTFPFLACSPSPSDRAVVHQARTAKNVTIRNCPDGRNRLNINAFTGDVYVTDFAAIPSLGSIHSDRLVDIFDRWQSHPLFQPFNCYCPEAQCTGPNLIVAHVYHPGVDFRERKALPCG